MYFVNQAHKKNLEKLAEVFPAVRKNSEYRAACYIAAHPEIFKCFSIDKQQHGPFDWYFDYLDNPEDFIKRRDRNETSGDTAPLTGQTRELVELALNLWNGHQFDLSYGLSMWDGDLYRLALQAIDLRRSCQILALGVVKPLVGSDGDAPSAQAATDTEPNEPSAGS